MLASAVALRQCSPSVLIHVRVYLVSEVLEKAVTRVYFKEGLKSTQMCLLFVGRFCP